MIEADIAIQADGFQARGELVGEKRIQKRKNRIYRVQRWTLAAAVKMKLRVFEGLPQHAVILLCASSFHPQQ